MKLTYVMFCAIWYHLQNLKNVKSTIEVLLLHGCFSYFLNCTNGTKLRNYHICYIYLFKGMDVKRVQKQMFSWDYFVV